MKTENFSLPLATSLQIFHTLTRVIRYDEGIGTGTPTIRVRSLSSGEMDVEMKPGRQIILPKAVDGIIITNLTANAITGKITIGAGDVSDNSLVGTVTLDAATLVSLENVDLNPATLNTLTRPILPGASWNSSAVLVANTPVTIISPGANVNGALIFSMKARDDVGAATTRQVFIAKASAPANITDGEILAMTLPGSVSGTSDFAYIDEQQPTRIAPGRGLYYLSSLGSGSSGLRSCRYTLL